MAHFAELDDNNIVLRVIVVSNDDCLDPQGNESEEVGAKFCHNLLGGRWVQTSYNSNFRKRYAGIGYTYNEELDAFITPKPYPSWTLDEATASWVSPVEYPSDGNEYMWNEESNSWVAL